MEDLYSILEVSKTATQDQIKASYKKLARKYHPDLHPGDKTAEEKFKQINAAYDVLGDAARRAQYDSYGSNDAQSAYNSNWSGQSAQDPWSAWASAWQQHQQQQNNYSQNDDTYGAWHTYTNYERRSYTKGDYLISLLRNLVITAVCFSLSRFSIIFFPFGPILCFAGIVSGIGGIIKSLHGLLTSSGK
ncbi:MAG: DnaJ domain-containing protein [Treponema sp.]|nr:DnaJ domain-containing protein [Treponema sp.]